MLPRATAIVATRVLGVTILASSATSCVLIAEIDYNSIPKPDAGTSDGGPMPECTDDAACDDESPCTVDTCEAEKCVFTPAAEGTTCGASVTCSITYACDASGACAGTPVVIDDADVCTTDACDPETGEVSHTSASGACLSWAAMPQENAPSPRYNHSAIWTGTKLIIWGGETTGASPYLGDGAAYDPATNTWTTISNTNAPTARFGHRAVWTGSDMIVWGGYAESGLAGAGGIYDPTTDMWKPMSKTGEPQARIQHTAVWTGSYLVVWGGSANGIALSSGARYEPSADTWQVIPSAGSPIVRAQHSAVWSGQRMIVWGGTNFADWWGHGGMYEPTQNKWLTATASQDAPSVRESHTAVWTGSRMILWGGWNGGPFLDTGAIFDPSTGTQGAWVATSTQNAPSPRRDHTAVWTDSAMIVWGGCGGDLCGNLLGDGGRFVPSDTGGSWEPIPPAATLSARRGHTSVFTGTRILVWGGRDATGPLGTGAAALLQ